MSYEDEWLKRIEPFQSYEQCFARGIIALEFGPGWDNLMLDFLEQFQKVRTADQIILQTKEKFGGLRIYLSLYTTEVEELVAAAEQRANTTCEMTGRDGASAHVRHGWLRTLHPDYAAEIGYKPLTKHPT